MIYCSLLLMKQLEYEEPYKRVFELLYWLFLLILSDKLKV